MINTSQLRELRNRYRDSDSRRERREIELDVLDQVLWEGDEPSSTPFATYSLEELRLIADAVDADASEEVSALLRAPLLQLLD